MLMNWRQLILLAGLLSCSGAQAGYFNGHRLLNGLRAAEYSERNRIPDPRAINTALNGAVAVGYVMGIADAAEGKTVCRPSQADVRDVKNTVIGHLNANSHRLRQSGEYLALEALENRWPCKPKRFWER
jgi:hypothetical protein